MGPDWYEQLLKWRFRIAHGARFALTSVLVAFHAAIDFAFHWLLTRPVMLLLPALPAIVAAAVPLGFFIASQQTSQSQLIVAYNGEVLEAFEEEDYETADLYLRKMTYLDDSNPSVLYALATAAERREELPRARDLMRRVAPEDSQGYADAHYWLACDLIRDAGQLAPEQVASLQHHLEQTIRQQPEHQEALPRLAALHRARGNFKEAISLFLKTARRQPQHLLAVAQLHAFQGDVHKARSAAEAAASRFERLTKSEPGILQHRLTWAESQRFLESFPEAIRILRESGQTDQRLVQPALTSVYLSWYDHVTRTDRDDLARRLELLHQALALEPDNQTALSKLASLAVVEDSDAAAKELKVALAKGTAPATVHFILGTSAATKGQHLEAARHLELAFAESPQMPAVANNLAWALAHRDPPDLQRAEQLIEAAAKIAPQHPEIRETRGVIRTKLGKQTGAIADLEFALRAFPRRAHLHDLLAELYDEIGDPQLADEHRKLAAEKTPSDK